MVDVKLLATILVAFGIIGGCYYGYQAYSYNNQRQKCLDANALDSIMGERTFYSESSKREDRNRRDRCAEFGVY